MADDIVKMGEMISKITEAATKAARLEFRNFKLLGESVEKMGKAVAGPLLAGTKQLVALTQQLTRPINLLNQFAATGINKLIYGFNSLRGGLGGLSAGFSQIESAMTSTVSAANPAQFIRYQFAVADLAAVIGRILSPAFEDLIATIRSTADYINGLSPATKALISNVAKLAVSLTAVGGAFRMVGPLLTVMTAGFTPLLTVAGALGGVLGPVGIAAVGLGGAFALLATQGDKVKQALGPFGFVVDVLQPGVNAVKDTVVKLAESMRGPLLRALDSIMRVAIPLGKLALAPLINYAKLLAGLIPRLAPGVRDLAASFLNLAGPVGAVVGSLAGTLDKLFQGITPVVLKAGDLLGKFASDVGSKLGKFFDDLQPFADQIGATFARFGEEMQPIFERIGRLVDEQGPKLMALASDLVGGFLAQVISLMPLVVQSVDLAAQAFVKLADAIVSVDEKVGSMSDSLSGLAGGATGIASGLGLGGGLTSFMPGGVNALFGAGGKPGEAPGAPPKTPGGDPKKKPEKTLEELFKQMLESSKGLANETKASFATIVNDLKKPTKVSSVGAAARQASFMDIAELGKQAQLAAFGAGIDNPAKKTADNTKMTADNTLVLANVVQQVLYEIKHGGKDPDRSRQGLNGF